MIFTDDLIFIHIGKTGGMSCADYLLHTLRRPVHNCNEFALTEAESLGIAGVVAVPDIQRHCTLAEALDFIRQFNGRSLAQFAKVVTVVRHPYTLEYCFYKHLQKPHIRAMRPDEPRLLELADGDFRTFVEQAAFHREGFPQEAFFHVDGRIPPQVELVRFEDLVTAFPRAVAPFVRAGAAYPFPHHNRTEYDADIRDALSGEVRELIYRKHRFMFDSGLYSTGDAG